MTRVADILVRCRDSLADEDKSRWSDARLLRLIDEAQKKIARKNELLRRVVNISILSGQNEYTLPSDAFLLTRVVNEEGGKIGIKSHADMDDLGVATLSALWENDTGDAVEYIIFDNQAPGVFKTYPIVTDVAAGEVFVISDFGVTTAVEYDVVDGDFGVVVDITEAAPDTNQFNSDFGVVTAMSEVTEVLKIYYRAKPSTIALETDLLEIDDAWDAAIKHYVVSMALHDDQDTQNRAVSSDELQLYSIEAADAKQTSAKDNTSRSHHRTSYNSGI